jgi:hypothetical protein
VPLRLSLAAPLLALLLAGCWAGKPFYSKSELEAPIAPGLYRTIEEASSSEHGRYRISVRPDGYTALKRADSAEAELAGFAALPGADGTFVAWFEESSGRPVGVDEGTTYGLLQRQGAGYVLSFPVCSETRALAEAAGGSFKADPKVPMCLFPDRASLEAGLRRVAAEGPLEKLRLVPVGKDTRD